LDLHVRSVLGNQELVTRKSTQVTYWEGSVSVTGTAGGKPVDGLGYAELTGYAGAMRLSR
jgi:predicted secreted hydrolase